MQRFKPSDAVFILPKFAHLYRGSSAVVRAVKPDPFRSTFNEYTLEFADGSSARVLEFQLIDDWPDYETRIADVVFDSRKQMPKKGVRGETTRVQIVFHSNGFDVDIKIQMHGSGVRSLLGQILETNTSDPLKDLHVRLMREGVPLAATVTDDNGVFEFGDIPAGPLNILVVSPERLVRILGAFSL